MNDTPAYAAYAGKPDSYFANARTEIAPLLPDTIGDVLEIGCGSGGTMAWLRATRTVAYAAGIELVPAAAQAARAVFDDVQAASLEDPGNLTSGRHYDLILALDVLEHLVDPHSVVAAMRDRLKPDGCLIISVPNVANYSVSWELFLSGRWRYQNEGHLDRTHMRFFDEVSARDLLEQAGLVIDKTGTTEKQPSLDHTNLMRSYPWLRWQSRKLIRSLLPRHMCVSQFLLRAHLARDASAGKAD